MTPPSDRSFAGWSDVFGVAAVATAPLNPLLHHAV